MIAAMSTSAQLLLALGVAASRDLPEYEPQRVDVSALKRLEVRLVDGAVEHLQHTTPPTQSVSRTAPGSRVARVLLD